MSWTDERVEALKRLWQDGLSASQIAAEIGGVTRNAVIGKVHKLGLSGRGQPTTTAKRQRRTPQQAPRRPRQMVSYGNLALKIEAEVVMETRPAQRRDVVVPISKRLTIEKLTEKTCKWPEGDPTDPDFHFCGHDSLEGVPYCAYHAGVAYQVPDKNRNRKRASG